MKTDLHWILLVSSMAAQKRDFGQFYTMNCEYILDGLECPADVRRIVEPFAGQGDLLTWVGRPAEAYDIDPKDPRVVQRDTLRDPPDYTDAWVLTNPPYLARNKCEDKELFDRYGTNDLYKCFLQSLRGAAGGLLILPVGFFLSPREIDVRCRDTFLREYRILRVRYFEEPVFADTTAAVVAFTFTRAESGLSEQTIPWTRLPANEDRTFQLRREDNWIVGGDIYRLTGEVSIRRHVSGKPLAAGETMTALQLCAMDSSEPLRLEVREGYVYPAKDSSRTHATLVWSGPPPSLERQQRLCQAFNALLTQKREETWSLFLPHYREYARKRIPFDLAYAILSWIQSNTP